MTTYNVTPSNWNNPSFWAQIRPGTAGHRISFEGLPNHFSIDFNMESGMAAICDGTRHYRVGDAACAGRSDATLGVNALWGDFIVTVRGEGQEDGTEGGIRNRPGAVEGFTADRTGVVCFTQGTAIRTPKGEVLIEQLRVGDLVCTLDNGPRKLRWIGRRLVSVPELHAEPHLRPVHFQENVLGNTRPIAVSRLHGMLLDSDAFAKAVDLARAMKGVGVLRPLAPVTYFHLMFDVHEVVFAEGIASESFYPSPQALAGMGAASAPMHELFPRLNVFTPNMINARMAYGPPARVFMGRPRVEEWVRDAVPKLALAG